MSQTLFAALILCLIGPINAVIAATVNARYAGLAWGLGNRGTEPDLPGWARRLSRSHANLLENLPSFLGVVLIGYLLHVDDQVSILAAWGFVACRMAFAVVYTAGITVLAVRTLLYFGSLGCLGIMAWRIVESIAPAAI
jgi:uncharacterized MAPEG superfamily protein